MKVYIAFLNQDTAEVRLAETMDLCIYDGRRMVALRTDNGDKIYYERIDNIANTKKEAIQILKQKIKNLSKQVEEIVNE